MTWYGLVVNVDGSEHVMYDGPDLVEAQEIAICEHKMREGRAYVSIMRDGVAWRHVKHVPGRISTATVTDAGFCLHPLCGEINPLSCYCHEEMTEAERARYAEMYPD